MASSWCMFCDIASTSVFFATKGDVIPKFFSSRLSLYSIELTSSFDYFLLFKKPTIIRLASNRIVYKISFMDLFYNFFFN